MQRLPQLDVLPDTLLVSNDSKTRASGTAGGLFRLGEIKRRQMSLLVSFQFTQGTTSTLDGVLFGGAFELNPYVHIVGGPGVRKGKELSPGFRRAAHAAIQAQIAINNPAFARFSKDKPEKGDESILDGLPLTMPGSDAPFFPGEPIVDSYNWSFFLGITVPVRLNALLGGQ